jgi:hypothetical protein
MQKFEFPTCREEDIVRSGDIVSVRVVDDSKSLSVEAGGVFAFPKEGNGDNGR